MELPYSILPHASCDKAYSRMGVYEGNCPVLSYLQSAVLVIFLIDSVPLTLYFCALCLVVMEMPLIVAGILRAMLICSFNEIGCDIECTPGVEFFLSRMTRYDL